MKDMMSHHKSIIERNTDEVDTEKRDPEQILRMADRLRLYKTIKPFLPSEDCETAAGGSKETSPFATVWEVSLLFLSHRERSRIIAEHCDPIGSAFSATRGAGSLSTAD